MAADTLSERLSSKLHLQTKKVGEDRIRRAKENDEDIAIFSMFPMEGDSKFRCCLGNDCLLGDPKKADPGETRETIMSFDSFRPSRDERRQKVTKCRHSSDILRIDPRGHCETKSTDAGATDKVPFSNVPLDVDVDATGTRQI